MAGRKKNPEQTAATRKKLLETGYRLFSQKNIETVSMAEIARESGVGEVTVYRYFPTKPDLVIGASIMKWEEFMEANKNQTPAVNIDKMTAVELFGAYLDSFIRLYKEHKEFLRFNQFFNVYITSENVETDVFKPHDDMMTKFKSRFHIIYEKGTEDKTLRTDIPEEKIFSTTLHLMLAAVTRYAVGLVYKPSNKFDPVDELMMQKEALLALYSSK